MYASMTCADVLKEFQSAARGLHPLQIEEIRAEWGWNELPRKRRSRFRLFLRQFESVLVVILLGALVLSLALPFLDGHGWTAESMLDAGVILAILLLNAVLGYVQEHKAQQAISMLERLTSPMTRVRRDGQESIIPSRELVPGDIVIIEAGDRISADGRILKAARLALNESSLTGESVLAEKSVDALAPTQTVLAEQSSMLFAGTLVARGSGEYIVTAIGLHTEIGKIATLVEQTEQPPTPLALRIRQLSRLLGGVILCLSLLVVAVSLWQGRSLITILLTGAALAVAAVPEGLPAVVTVCLAMGVRRMVQRHALIRRLDALETLGSVTVICTDKTGTLTENRMRVVEVWVPEGENEEMLIQAAASCNRAQLPNLGDPTEIGLLEYAEQEEVHRLPIEEEEIPFSSEEKYMQTRHKNDAHEGTIVFLKGAPEKIAALCGLPAGGAWMKQNHTLAKGGLRVLACAVEENGVRRFIGLIGMEDRPRATVAKALLSAKQAGIRTIMITGDSVETARAIARQVGIEGDALSGTELDALSEHALRERVRTVGVFARVTPLHKLAILDALKANGEIVAMSGDGVNDAPALKGAHVGVAMGKIGTDTAREAAGIVLADDDYATIVAAVAEGRRIYDNIRKFVLYLVHANFGEILLILVATLLGLPLPLLPLHILWVNLMTDSLPALALGMEPGERDIMARPPRPASEHLFTGQWGLLIVSVYTSFLLTLLLFLMGLSSGATLEKSRTFALTFLILFELFLAFTIRSPYPFWRSRVTRNPWLLLAVTIPLLLHILVLATPVREAFELTQLSQFEWFGLALVGLMGFLILELTKALHGHRADRMKSALSSL